MIFLHVQVHELHAWNIKEIAQLPTFSSLELNLYTQGHVYGAMVRDFLGSCPRIQSLKLSDRSYVVNLRVIFLLLRIVLLDIYTELTIYSYFISAV